MTLSHHFHRIVACCLFLLVVASASAQEKNIRITFTGWDNTGSAAVALDSVRVRDLATARDTLILSPFILDVRILTGVDGLTTAAPKGLDVSSNFANPFTDNTRFLVTTRGTRALSAALYSVDGRSVTQLTLSVADGSHEFVLHGAALANGVYILRVDNGEAVRSIRLVKQGLRAGGSARIEHSASHAVAPRVTLGKRAIPMPLRCTGFASGCPQLRWRSPPVRTPRCASPSLIRTVLRRSMPSRLMPMR